MNACARAVGWVSLSAWAALSAFMSVAAAEPSISLPVEVRDTDRRLVAALEDFIPHVLKYYGTPGLNLAVGRQGQVIWEGGFGYADLEHHVPMTADTVFHSGSMGKTYTATAVMQLVERRFLALDAPINQYLPGFRIDNPLGDRPITVRDLLTHRSGLTGEAAGSTLEAPAPLAAYIRQIYSQKYFPEYQGSLLPLWSHKAGETYEYSNLGIATLGYLVEVVNPEHLSFSAYVQRHIIDPLGMKSTQFPEIQDAAHIRPDIYQRMSTGYMHFGAVHLPTPLIYFAAYPAGTVVSIPRDHIRMLFAYLNGGFYNNYQLLKPETVALMLTPQAEIGEGRSVGLVWEVSSIGTQRYKFGHRGSHMWGWANEYAAFPAEDLAMVIATNHWNVTNDSKIYEEASAIMDFACSWIDNERIAPHADKVLKPWSWRVSYVLGLVVVERTNGGLGINTPISAALEDRMASGEVLQAGTSYGEALWDSEGFRAGVRDMQAVKMVPAAIRSFLSSKELRVPAEDLPLISQEIGARGIPIPWNVFVPEPRQQ